MFARCLRSRCGRRPRHFFVAFPEFDVGDEVLHHRCISHRGLANVVGTARWEVQEDKLVALHLRELTDLLRDVAVRRCEKCKDTAPKSLPKTSKCSKATAFTAAAIEASAPDLLEEQGGVVHVVEGNQAFFVAFPELASAMKSFATAASATAVTQM